VAAQAAAAQTMKRRKKEEQKQLAEYERASRDSEADFDRTLRAMHQGREKP
jgi:hypothetical protein